MKLSKSPSKEKKKSKGFSDFFHSSSLEEKKEIFAKAAQMSNDDQRNFLHITKS